MSLQEVLTSEWNFRWLLVSIMPRIIITIVCILVCYKLAVKANKSKAMAFLGIFGIFGIVVMFIILAAKNGGTDNRTFNNQQMGNNYGQYNNQQMGNNYGQYNNQQTGNNYGQYNNQQTGSNYQQNNGYQQNINPFTDTVNNSENAFRTETIDSENYKFNGGMNVCETHQEHNDTHTGLYGDVVEEQASQERSYNLNGENISYGKGLCPHCGAKLKKFQRFCDSCGSRV